MVSMQELSKIRQHATTLSAALNEDDWQSLRSHLKNALGMEAKFHHLLGWDGLMQKIAKAQLETGCLTADPDAIVASAMSALDQFDKAYNPNHPEFAGEREI